MTLDETISRNLTNAREYAREGEALLMETTLDLATRYAEEAGQDVSQEREEIEKMGYAAAVPKKLTNARGYAREGDASSMESAISLATMYAKEVGQDISQQVVEIRALIPE